MCDRSRPVALVFQCLYALRRSLSCWKVSSAIFFITEVSSWRYAASLESCLGMLYLATSAGKRSVLDMLREK
jgi:hypothetical protein